MKNWKRKIFKTFAKGKAKDPDPRSAQLPCPPPNLEATYRSELGRLDGGNGVTLDLSPIDLGFGDLSFNGDPAGDARPNNADTENVGPNEVRPGLPDLMAAMTLPSVLETKMILREDGLLDVNLQDSDPRAAIALRNSQESPLLSLPGEIRNKIIVYAATGCHIHITRDAPPSLSFPPRPLVSLSSVPYEEPKQNNWKYRKPTSYHNNFYPLGDFRAGKEYTTHPVRITNCSMDEQPPDNRYVRGSGQAFPNLALVCRQMHAEVGVLPYLGNAFSFDSPYTMFHLLSSMLPVQRAALRVLWVDMEWRGALWGPHTDFAGLRLWGLDDNVQFVVSKVAVRGALERWHEKSGFRPEVLDLQLWYEEDRFWLWLAKNFLGPSASYGYLRLLDYVD